MRKSAPSGGRRTWGRILFRWVVLIIVGGYLLLPLLSMLEFSTRGAGWSRNFAAWKDIWTTDPLLPGAIELSLELAALTVVGMLFLLAPTMVWVQLRASKMRRVVEFISLLPLTIPAIVIVVGLAPVYRHLSPLIGQSPLVLAFIYLVLVLPYAYRSIDASLRSIDVETLAEAARGLGASWPQVFFRIVVPNIRQGLLSAAVLSIALVLGEFTISSLLAYDTLQVEVNQVGLTNAAVSIAVALAALIFGFVLLFIVSSVGGGRRRRKQVALPAEGGLKQ
jgi:putative spermidine/putrescine transport system permease protein